jgi:VanZ family protein
MPSPDIHLHAGLGRRGVVAGNKFLQTGPEPSANHGRDRPSTRPWPSLLAVVCLLYAGALLWATHAPRISHPNVILGPIPSDKTLHFAAYAILGILTALKALSFGRTGVRVILWLTVGLAVFACADEITQPMCGRAAEALDWVADMAGAVTAVGLLLAGRRLFNVPSADVR